MKLQWKDKYGYPIEGFINRPFKSLFRLICQIVRGNARLKKSIYYYKCPGYGYTVSELHFVFVIGILAFILIKEKLIKRIDKVTNRNIMKEEKKNMTYREAKVTCHVRSAIYRESKPTILYPYNHHLSFDERIPKEDQIANDWKEYDPNDEYNLSLPAES